MYSCLALDEPLQKPLNSHLYKAPQHGSIINSTNKFVYIKKTCTNLTTELEPVKVLVNPNFNKKVFVNPNFNNNRNITSAAPPKIHVNPNATNLTLGNVNEYKNGNKIHVNPHVLKNVPFSVGSTVVQGNGNKEIRSDEKEINRTVISTRTKLIRSKAESVTDNKIKKRRLSVKSQFKIIKSAPLDKSFRSETEIKSGYNLLKSDHKYISGPESTKLSINKFKVDNRGTKLASPKGKKYIYINRFLSISDIAKNNLLKKNKNKLCVVNIGGVLYKKSPNVLKKTSNSCTKLNNMKKTRESIIFKSKYNFIRNSANTSKSSNKILKQPTVSKFGTNVAKSISRRVCNIPCPYYRKFGRCKGKENGKCFRKHDADKIALCTKFLQGACIDKKCLLSHNVSPEKMPTCKFYLEGSCSRDDCPYLHVRISPKADVCKDFLEGFCKKATECDKRHQFLCPDYEKNGSCLKQRCPYPHGKMVRKYSVFSKNKFAKKSSCDGTTNVKIDCNAKGYNTKSNTKNTNENCEGNIKSRYYIGQNNLDVEDGDRTHSNRSDCIDEKNDQISGIKSRPKLGKLPSFIAFESS